MEVVMKTEPETISVTDLRERTREILENAHFRGRWYRVERAGQPMALILGIDEFERLVALERAASTPSSY
jgi:hypothetical protein